MPRQTKPLTMAQFKDQMVEMTGLPKRVVSDFFRCQAELASQQLAKRGIGAVTLPDIGVKLQLKTKKATRAREGRNPATGETIMIAAKPRRKVIKASVLKKLKDKVLG